MAKAERKYTGVVMVGMSKAFDRVQHARMVSVLFRLGVSGLVLYSSVATCQTVRSLSELEIISLLQ